MKPLEESNVAVVGLGLMGASLAWKLRGDGVAGKVWGVVHRQETGRKAMERGLVDAIVPWEEALSADAMVLAAPVRVIVEQLRSLATAPRRPGLVVDLGSTKREIVRAMDALPEDTLAVGGHPMCGKETSGVDAADPELYRGCRFVVVPTRRSTPEAVAWVRDLARALGANPVEMEAGRHDSLVAAISHLPYLVSAALMNTVDDLSRDDDAVLELAAGGFRDTSRLAASNVTMMLDILTTNRDAVLEVAEAYRKHLDALVEALASGDEERLADALDRSRRARISWAGKRARARS
jgi:prephenate dehydrogenase